VKRLIARFAADQTGATAIEYGLIIGLIALAIVGALSQFSDSFNQTMGRINTALTEAMDD
jgi:pilus assembly protein Flp/PilA